MKRSPPSFFGPTHFSFAMRWSRAAVLCCVVLCCALRLYRFVKRNVFRPTHKASTVHPGTGTVRSSAVPLVSVRDNRGGGGGGGDDTAPSAVAAPDVPPQAPASPRDTSAATSPLLLGVATLSVPRASGNQPPVPLSPSNASHNPPSPNHSDGHHSPSRHRVTAAELVEQAIAKKMLLLCMVFGVCWYVRSLTADRHSALPLTL